MTSSEALEAAVREARRRAADEAERMLREGAKALRGSPERLGEVEKGLRNEALKAGGSILGQAMALAGNGYEGSRRACACGKTQKYMNDREREVVTLLGVVRLKRSYYWCAACHRAEAPLDVRLQIEGTPFTPGVREMIGRVDAEVAFERGRELMGALANVWVSKRTHEQVAEGIGAEFLPERRPEKRALPANRRAVDQLYLSADGTTAPTLDGWREVKIGAIFEGHRGRDGEPRRDATRYFGDVTDSEAFGERWYQVARSMGLEDAHRVIVLGDGAAWIWNLAELHFPGAIQIVDWFHATERLWIVACACFGEGTPEARAWEKAAEDLLAGGRVERVLRRMARLRPRRAEAKELLREAQGYFRNNAARMRYDRFRRLGLFIGSGVVEAGCKHIVGARLKQSGMRWSHEGLRSILHLRLAVLNGDWPQQRDAA
ncbi:MAG: ISKra4 family transposase [Chthoniobacteraceae bacterium]|nr:ISKra4 family transposase [Chthoniobacteraceae bacterium]